jgi:hypothetical protein
VGNTTIIELNGKRYDAATGAFLGASHVGVGSARASNAHEPAKHTGRAIDGVVHNSHPKSAAAIRAVHDAKASHIARPVGNRDGFLKGAAETQRKAHKPIADSSANKPAISSGIPKPPVHRSVKAAKPHQPEKPKTLMRRSVLKPKFSLKPAIKVQLPAEVAAMPAHAIAPKQSADQIDPLRLAHSRQIARSATIQRFSAAQATGRPQNTEAGEKYQPHANPVQHIPVRPMPNLGVPHSSNAKMRPDVQHAARKPAADLDMFDTAIARATSHQQPAPIAIKRRRRRIFGIALGFGALVIVASLAAYVNRPAIEIRLASSKAGFHAQLPVAPTGYTLRGAPQVASNSVAITFGSGNSVLKLVEQPSNLNSQSLPRTDKAVGTALYQTVVAGTALIYRYDSTDAAWVDGGILYTLTGNAELSNDQIIAFASSL